MKLDLNVQSQRGDFRLDVAAQLHGVTGVFGANGSGKSTLLHAIAGVVPSTGRIAVGGKVLQDTAQAGMWWPPELRRVGVVFQDHRLFPHMTVAENLRFGQRTAGRLSPVVELLELGALLDRWPAQLSGGESQRVAIGRALLCEPELLLLDEPFSALDVATRRRLLPVLRRVIDASQAPVLLVSHQLPELLALTPSILLLDAGGVVGHGLASDVLKRGVDNVLRVTGIRVDESAGLVHAQCQGVALSLPLPAPINGAWVALNPHDVLLAVGEPGATSARNDLKGTVTEIRDGPVVVVRVDVGFDLSVEVTRAAVAQLGLEPGCTVRCLAKATAFRWLG